MKCKLFGIITIFILFTKLSSFAQLTTSSITGKIKDAKNCKYDLVALGESMIRLSPPPSPQERS